MFHCKKYILTAVLIQVTCPCGIADSLWLSATNKEAGLFSDRVAKRKGDIVLLEIDEVIKNKDQATTAAEHAQKYTLAQKVLDEVKRQGGPKISIPQQYEPTDELELKSEVSMMVIDVLPNGNIILEGVCKKRFFDNYQFQTIRGIARQDDISYDNKLKSSRLCNMTIEHLTGTSPENAENNGIFTKLNDFMNF